MKRHYEGLAERMLSEINTISDRMSHAGEKGRNNELVLREFLNGALPKRFAVTTGKVIAVGGLESGQIDLIIHDRFHTPALMEAHAWSIVPIESVYAIISVKTTLDKEELRDALSSVATVRARPRRAAINYEANNKISWAEDQTVRPRGFIFGFKSSWSKPEAMDAAFRDLLPEFDDSLRPNAVCALDQCLITRKPYKTETILFKEHALMHFFIFLTQVLDTFPRYQVDLRRYFDDDYGNGAEKKA